VCALLSCVPLPAPDAAECVLVAPAQSTDSAPRDELLDLVEQARLSGGRDCGNGELTPPVAAVRPDARLYCAASLFADDRAANGGSTLTDSNGQGTEDRMEQVGYSVRIWAEGFGVSARGPAEAWSQMLQSFDFCRYFADARLTDIGVAISGDVYVVTLGSE
jgi:uncharacterized protein YkwD